MSELNIKSTTVEKGIDLAKDFLDKLITPAVEETGLLIKDQVTLWKFKNQINILNKAKAHCEKKGITTKAISLKLICPLLENAALEEDELLQSKWAVLLANMADSEQNVENHVFPYLLSQISKEEFLVVDSALQRKLEQILPVKIKLKKYIESTTNRKEFVTDRLVSIKTEMKHLRSKQPENWQNKWRELDKEKENLGYEAYQIKTSIRRLKGEIHEPANIPEDELKEYEISNLIRLGLLKHVPHSNTILEGKDSIRISPELEYVDLGDLSVFVEHDYDEYLLTELGEMFLKACSEKEDI